MTSFGAQPRPAPAVEAGLLNLFAPTSCGHRTAGTSHAHAMTSLWREDALHRAKNLAQLSASLAHIVAVPTNRWGAAEAAAPARALARTYEALSFDNDSSAQVPCLHMISEVASQLGQIFGRNRNIGVHVSGDEVYATSEHRRVLALICSELVINALKYAFPGGSQGMIAVTLASRPGGIELAVSDNGIGIGENCTFGQGSKLTTRLAHVSGAALVRSTSSGGVGLCVTVTVPVAGPVAVFAVARMDA